MRVSWCVDVDSELLICVDVARAEREQHKPFPESSQCVSRIKYKYIFVVVSELAALTLTGHFVVIHQISNIIKRRSQCNGHQTPNLRAL